MASKRKLPSRTASEIKISTGQKVLVGVALLAGLGAVAAGFASLPGRNPCDGKDGKSSSNTFIKSEPCYGKDGKNGKGYTTAQYSSSQKPTIQSQQKNMPYVRIFPGMVVKIQGDSSLFYVGTDMKRYVFFNTVVLNSWFPNGTSITTVPASQMTKLVLGGNVYIRPGSLPVKIESEPSVFTITKGGVLHKIDSEKLAEEYYGPKWNLKVLTISKKYASFYSMGDLVGASTSAQTKKEYSPATQLATVTTIDQDLGLK